MIDKKSLLAWVPRFGTYTRVGNSTDAIFDGHLKLVDFPAVRFDLEDPEWNDSRDVAPYNEPGWRLYLHSLTWLTDPLLEAGRRLHQAEQAERFRLVVDVIRSWAADSLPSSAEKMERWNGHCTALRATTLLTLSTFLDEDWLMDALREHGSVLMENFSGYWNHGLVESVILYALGEVVEEESFRTTGIERLTECVDVMVDDEGAINEQAPTYAGYVWRLLRDSRTAVDEKTYPEIHQTISHKLESLEDFITNSLQPDGRHVELGDSYPDLPGAHPGSSTDWFVRPAAGGKELRQTTASYSRGYVFSRASWERDQPDPINSYVTARFGPGRVIHGHNDHTSLTLWEYGRKILVDSGHVGYKQGPLRRHVQSHDAHNVVTVQERRLDSTAETTLDFLDVDEANHRVRFSMSDQAYQGVSRHRTVAIFHDGPLVVLDRISNTLENGPITATQTWHLSPEFTIDQCTPNESNFVSALGDLKLKMVSFNVDAEDPQGIPGFSYWRGSESPLQGWAAAGRRHAVPSPTIGYSSRGQDSIILTAILPSPSEEEVSWSFRRGPQGVSVLRLHHGSSYYPINVSHDPHADPRDALSFR